MTRFTSSTVWPPRQTWPDERRDLTPWVAGHLRELGDKLGMRLTLVGREVPIGRFRADLEAADEHGRKVIIENQFGPTDHEHLGKIVAYRHSTDVVVWLATDSHRPFILHGFRPEHCEELRELNERYGPKVSFYGVELSVESKPMRGCPLPGPPMQIFRVVAAPKDSGIPETGCRGNHWQTRRPNGEAGSQHLVLSCEFADIVIVRGTRD
jgi:hypothetical protein